MQIRTVTLIGATGRLGPSILTALLSHNFKVQILRRSNSTSAPPPTHPHLTETILPDTFPEAMLETALQNQDAVICTIPGTETTLQKRLALAASKAGVKRFIPADFGSVDSESPRAREWVPLYVSKQEVRQYLQQLSNDNAGFTYTSLVCGHFFDHDPMWLHIDIAKRRADVLDEGDVPASACTMARIGEATARILLKAGEEEGTRNVTLFVQSFCKTQMEVVRAFERATGEGFDVKRIDGMAFAEERMGEMRAGDRAAMEDVVWVLGAYEADWRRKEGFANGLLGLEEESLDDVCKRIVDGCNDKKDGC
ncbi:hypothetical protein FKW77_003187 [Venturia effusa]|uniref:NmrA-like domain-containing protein n=1 Tax=Venturia effusa TaxID=50376 RepID=A0A517LGU0_9PEZI|nr:hypothetical protein FKW77_003187 [Venturia effusa]